MLPSELLFSIKRGSQVYPRFLKREQQLWAGQVLELIRQHQHRTRGELQAALRALEGDSPDYRIVRGFAHLALNAAEFTLATGELEPETLRREVFARAAERGSYGETQAREILESVAPARSWNPSRRAINWKRKPRARRSTPICRKIIC